MAGIGRVACTAVLWTLMASSGCATSARTGAAEGGGAGLSVDDASAVKSVVSAFAESWNRHDMQAMHELDTDDVQWVNVVGHHWRGKATVARGHTAIHRTLVATQSMRVDAVEARSIAPGVAVAVATMWFGPGSPGPDGNPIPEARTRGSFVLVKGGGEWKIAHFHNTVIDSTKEDPATWDLAASRPGTPSGR